MPFFDDSGIAAERHRGPVVGAFATFGEQVERMVAVNITWAVSLLPAAVALAVPALPGWLRLGLVAATSLALIPATGALYALAARAGTGEQIDTAGAWAAVRELARPSLQALTPLVALLFVLAWTGVLASSAGLVAVAVAARVALLLLLVTATYWGPLLVALPRPSAARLLAGSGWLVWRHPAATLKTMAVVVVVGAFGVVTVAGTVLAVPMLTALLHTHVYRIKEGVW